MNKHGLCNSVRNGSAMASAVIKHNFEQVSYREDLFWVLPHPVMLQIAENEQSSTPQRRESIITEAVLYARSDKLLSLRFKPGWQLNLNCGSHSPHYIIEEMSFVCQCTRSSCVRFMVSLIFISAISSRLCSSQIPFRLTYVLVRQESNIQACSVQP